MKAIVTTVPWSRRTVANFFNQLHWNYKRMEMMLQFFPDTELFSSKPLPFLKPKLCSSGSSSTFKEGQEGTVSIPLQLLQLSWWAKDIWFVQKPDSLLPSRAFNRAHSHLSRNNLDVKLTIKLVLNPSTRATMGNSQNERPWRHYYHTVDDVYYRMQIWRKRHSQGYFLSGDGLKFDW